MRAARGYESPNAILNPGQLPILELELFCAPEPYRNRDAEIDVPAIPTGCST